MKRTSILYRISAVICLAAIAFPESAKLQEAHFPAVIPALNHKSVLECIKQSELSYDEKLIVHGGGPTGREFYSIRRRMARAKTFDTNTYLERYRDGSRGEAGSWRTAPERLNLLIKARANAVAKIYLHISRISLLLDPDDMHLMRDSGNLLAEGPWWEREAEVLCACLASAATK